MPNPTENIDAKLIEFGNPTQRQLEYIEAIDKHKSIRAAARSLGINKTVIRESLAHLTKKAALRGYSPAHDLTRGVAPGQMLRGASTLYKRGEVEPVLQWVKTKADDAARQVMMEAVIKALAEEVKGLSPVVDAPKRTYSNLLAVYPLGDPHFSVACLPDETDNGKGFGLADAKRLTMAAIDRLVQTAPAAETAILLPLGDSVHPNDSTNQTPFSHHGLNVDGRYPDIIMATVQAFRHAVLRCLEKHQNVVVRFVIGNHDRESGWAVAISIASYFENEPRVTVDLTQSAHWFYRFGKVLIGATHGDKSKVDRLLGVMACDRAEDWGQTKHRYFYLGHVHHQLVTELAGVTCESFRTLAPRDSYAESHGYRAGRDMRLIVHHIEHGEIERHRVDVGMLDAA